jgi:protein-arginine deiminase
MKARHLLTLTALLSLACRNDKAGEDSGDAAAEDPWADRAVYGFANLDDDDGDGDPDWGQDADGDDDRFTLTLESAMFDGAPGGAVLALELTGDTSDVRVLVDGDELLGASDDVAEVAVPDGDLELEIEFGTMGATANLAVVLDDGGEPVETMDVRLQAAPLILNHHLQPVERVFAMSATGSDGNQAFTDGFEDVLGDTFEGFGLARYGWDVWIQDEIELATMTAPDGRRIDVVIDSIRSQPGQYLGKLPDEVFGEEPDTMIETWGRGYPTSQDSFGNLEVSPPVTVGGVEYPFGRAYYGHWFREEMHADMVEMLEDQKVQDPFELDVGFLCVGHVDEFTTFVPDPSSEKGFKFIVGDVGLAYEFLEAQSASTRLPQYSRDHGYATIGEIVDDSALRAMNEEIQEDYIDPAVDQFKAELGLTEDDIIRIPAIFEEVRGCQGTTVGLIPGTANMTVAPLASGETHLFMPDPFLRPAGDDQGDDPFIAEIEGLLPEGMDFHWLDDWDYYHIMLGEVHCGSNVVRTPIDDWWEVALHLLDGGED